MESDLLYTKIAALPDELKAEVEDFVDFVTAKHIPKAVECRPKFGSAKGMISVSPDFDEPLEDFKDYM